MNNDKSELRVFRWFDEGLEHARRQFDQREEKLTAFWNVYKMYKKYDGELKFKCRLVLQIIAEDIIDWRLLAPNHKHYKFVFQLANSPAPWKKEI